MKKEFYDISIIIPSYNSEKYLNRLITALDNQTLLPDEIIIIDSKTNLDFLNKLKQNFKSLNIIFKILNEASYPGNKRNLGVRLSKNNIIAFLDTKTVPKKDWIENYINLLKNKKYDIIFGSTFFSFKTFLQKLINYATFGNSTHETTPGTILRKNIFISSGFFIENVRAGDDLEWRVRVKKNGFQFKNSEKAYLEYIDDNNNLFSFLKKIFIYSIHNSFVSVQTNIKSLYLLLLILFSTIIIPKWNYIIPNWKENIFYIPNITKIYISLLLFIYLFYVLSSFFFKIKNQNFSNNFFYDFFSYIILMVIFFTAYFWNRTIANGIDYGVWYIPHVTKIYVSSVVIISLLYRGLFNPLNKKIKLKNLFPFNWFFVGLTGLCIDIVKAPGYLIGALFLPFVKK